MQNINETVSCHAFAAPPARSKSGTMNRHWLLAAAAVLMLVTAHSALAQEEITLIAPNIIDDPIKQLIPAFEATTGHKIKATFGAVVKTKDQIVRGEAFDVPLVEVPYDAEVIASGNVVAASQTPLANVSIGVAVRKGAPKPDISTPEAVKRMLLAAKSIAYPDPSNGAAAGISVVEALKKLGIAEQMEPKSKLAQGGARAMALVASGDAEIGLTFLPGMTNPGIDVLGPLPREVSPPTVVVGFVSAKAKDPASAKQLLEYLSSADAAQVYKEQRFQPGR
jgi:molybdate transport system substrate-binding protein